jgi:putative transcriptional regulator
LYIFWPKNRKAAQKRQYAIDRSEFHSILVSTGFYLAARRGFLRALTGNLETCKEQSMMSEKKTDQSPEELATLEGQLLIAMPGMSDKRFSRSVVYLCAHSDEGAMGLIINHRADNINFGDLLERLEIVEEAEKVNLPETMASRGVHLGGPVETGRGFVLHSTDYYAENSTLEIDDEVSLTATIDILKALAAGQGPDRAILALGYAGWSPGQLEDEIQSNGWLHCPGDPDIVFDPDVDSKYLKALAKIGIDPSHLVSDAGHA